MRAYYFCNYYLSSIQQGIQSLHVTAEMFLKYSEASNYGRMLYDWATEHKTVVVKNGGDHTQISEIADLCASDDNPYPWAQFVEEGIGDQLTCVGVILPSIVYDAADELRKMPFSRREQFLRDKKFPAFDRVMCQLIVDVGLAR